MLLRFNNYVSGPIKPASVRIVIENLYI